MEKSPSASNKRSKKSTSKASSSEKNVEVDNIDSVLLSKGFAPISRIHMGEIGTSYVKAFTDLGHMCYVQLDTDKPSKREQDLSLIQVDTISKEPVKNGKLTVDECSRLEVCGVAYECNEGICVLRRDIDTFDLKEDIFTVTESSSLMHGIEKREPLSYPIVRYSEILANEVAVMWNISKVTSRLKVQAIHNYNKELMGIRQTVDRFTHVTNTLIEAMHAARDNVINLTISLHESRDKYDLPIDETDREAYSEIVNKLHTGDDLIGDLILTARTLSSRRQDIDNMTEEFITYFNELKDRYA